MRASLRALAGRRRCGTAVVLAGLLAAGAYQALVLDPAATRRWTMSADSVLAGEWIRLFSSALLHAGPLHFLMNFMSTAAIADSLERSAGTVRLLTLTLWFVPLSGLIACALAEAATLATGDASFARQHSLGFSGVLFALAVSESARNAHVQRSMFGLFNVSARLYPWALLVAMQLLVPVSSFVGHLGGLLAGSLEASGWLRRLAPSTPSLDARLAGALPGYCVAGDDPVRAESGVGDVALLLWHVVTFLAAMTGVDRCLAAARRRVCGMAEAARRCVRPASAYAVVPAEDPETSYPEKSPETYSGRLNALIKAARGSEKTAAAVGDSVEV